MLRAMTRAGDDEMGRSVRMPKSVWRALDADAARSRRSATKQLEAILTVYYGLDSITMADVPTVRGIVSPHLAREASSRAAQAERMRRLIETADPRHEEMINALEDRLQKESQSQTLLPEDLPARRAG